MVSSTLSSSINDPEITTWLESATPKLSSSNNMVLRHALDYAIQLYADHSLPSGERVTRHILATVSNLILLKVDSDTLTAGMLHAIPNYLDDYVIKLQTDFNPTVANLVEGVSRTGRIQKLSNKSGATNHTAQIEAVRKMLLAMVEDIRVVIIALASREQTIRYAVTNNIPERVEIALETLDIFAPLANRLGLWQIKWVLEDLSLRVIEPERYKEIVQFLEETRTSREQYIGLVIAKLQHELKQTNIEAEVTGRPKHIYSIYKKMKRKDLAFSEIYDARAVRILVDDINNCYAALGVVHNLWTPISQEFDDYIAKPKSNDYRSLHTAVFGPKNKVVEVQIRTHEMHRYSELGVASHWRYKEGTKRNTRYDEKIAWLRQILEWKNDVSGVGELAEHFKTAPFEDSVYVLTPQDKVIALPKGATPVDFAYHVHTELGHHCRGAKVDGAIVSLDYPLKNTQRVEIISAKHGGPSRDWLNRTLGYLKSHRARSKVRQWFNSQELEATLIQGRAIIDKALQRHGMTTMSLDKFASKFNFIKLNDFFIAVAKGNINNHQLATALNTETEPTAAQVDLLAINKSSEQPNTRQIGSGIRVAGVDNLLTVLAKCCRPVPSEPIIGFVTTRGRGVTIHRQGCSSLSRLSKKSAERLVEADWGSLQDKHYPVDIEIKTYDRQGLLRDISDILLREKVNIVTINSQKRHGMVTLKLVLEVSGMTQLHRVLGFIREIPNLVFATRKQK